MTDKKKLKVKSSKIERVLLTDTLPYEVPLAFSNIGFYKHLINKKESNEVIDKIFNLSNFTIPYSYTIKKSSNSIRKLDIVHPATQLLFCDFYDKYESLIINSCKKSDFSLRYPAKIASHYYEKPLGYISQKNISNEVETANNGFSSQEKQASSHFSYKNFPFMYKFYDSYEFHRLERKFKYLLRFDISKCFHNIYTHSFSWATTDKEFAKENQGKFCFFGRFDQLMQWTNYNETNGIVVGPEFSRIFAEVILQDIDVIAEQKILKGCGLNHGSDYEVRRYIDDYFIFYNSKDSIENIFCKFKESLEEYKLYINDSKTQYINRPFITGSTVAKSETREIVDFIFTKTVNETSLLEATDIYKKLLQTTKVELSSEIKNELNNYLIENNLFNKIGSTKLVSNIAIRELKSSVWKNDAIFENITSYLFTAISNKLDTILPLIEFIITNDNQLRNFRKFCSIILSFVFFFYSMDIRVRATYLISRIILAIYKSAEITDDETKEYIRKVIIDEVMISFKANDHDIQSDQVELLNLLICLKSFDQSFIFSQKQLMHYFGIQEHNAQLVSNKKISYFTICTLLFYIEDNSIYSELSEHLVQEALNIISSKPSTIKDTEATMLCIDLSTCPHLSKANKNRIISAYLNGDKKQLKQHERNGLAPLRNFLEGKIFFYDWSATNNLEQMLMKKELRSPY